MERKASFKECPKCGLRNKPSATQCDFCGQNLGTSDDWQQHIKDLESLNKMELRKPVDDRTSKRIESTIIRKDAPVIRNVEIKEAGSVGKALKELDTAPAKDKVGEAKDERPCQAPIPDKLRIKEASSVPQVEVELKKTQPLGEGTTIAEILSEPAKRTEVKTPPAEPPVVQQEPSPEPVVLEAVEEPVMGEAETQQPIVEFPPEQEKKEEPRPPLEEPLPEERQEETPPPAAAPEPAEEIVPAKEVTVEIVQPPQEEVVPDQDIEEGEEEVAISTNDSHATIKLKLVEVERPKEKLAPTAIVPSMISGGMTAVAVLALGSIAYLVVLVLTAIGTLGPAAGLGGGAVSSFMIIYGAVVVYPSLRKKKVDEVYICPKCHEKVGEGSEGCPACGAESISED